MMKRTFVLIILDGWGIGRNDESNPIWTAKLPTFGWLMDHFPVTSLQASGISVGLPWGETGNSEVGHLTLGAGKVIYQYYPRITLAIRDKTFFANPALKAAFAHAKKNNSAVNLAGLLSRGNVHASLEHLTALIDMASQEQVPVKLHLFADGKDGKPHTLEELLAHLPADRIGSIIGRYFAMNRESNWDLTRQAYAAMTGQVAESPIVDLKNIIAQTYQKNATEEYFGAFCFSKSNAVAEHDALIFFNYREDSIRQLAESFINKSFSEFPTTPFADLFIATMTQYKESFSVPVAFPPQYVTKPLGKVLSDHGSTQLRLAETYKQAHVTYFFNGFKEEPFKNEYRVLLPSSPVLHPDEYPAMMAEAITDRLIEAIENHSFDFVLVNYANPDTIAHTGNFKATEEAVRAIDTQLARVLKAGVNPETLIIITSDHGNAEQVADPATGHMQTGHDPNPVPLYLVAPEFEGKTFSNKDTLATQTTGIISDVAPTLLELMGIQKPSDMSGESLLKELRG